MQPHIVNYHKALGYSFTDYIGCECCASKAVDIHHIIPRSKFGSKRKAEQDHANNLVALCRVCHNLAHDNVITKEQLQIIVSKRISL
jgi:5-methylcytosine-specific restriction endonuclease McrA